MPRACVHMPGKRHLPELHLQPMQLNMGNMLCDARLCPTLTDRQVSVQLEAQLNATLEQKAWLTVGIPTVPRKNGADYLTRTLDTLLQVEPSSYLESAHIQWLTVDVSMVPRESWPDA